MKKVLLIGIPLAILVAATPLGLRKLQTDAILRRASKIGAGVETDIRAYEARDRARPPLFLPAVEGTAWDYYRRAAVLSDEIVAGLPNPLSPAGVTGLPAWPGSPHPMHGEWEGMDPPTIAEVLPEGAREDTSRGPWSWRSATDVSHRWIERGPPLEGDAEEPR